MEINKEIKNKIILENKDMRLDIFLNKLMFSRNGYYFNKKPIGGKKDFITSPEISQMFGEIVGSYLFYIWKTKINRKFNLIELGPGNGTLFTDIVNSVSQYPDFFNKARIQFVENNYELIKIQKRNIKKILQKNINWSNSLNFHSINPCIIYSNEFFDCFPVRQFILKENWYEKYINYNKKTENFYFKENIVKEKKLLEFLSNYQEDKILEFSPSRNIFFEKICKLLKKNGGMCFTIDYGYIDNLKNFTLQSVQNHKFSNLFDNLGNQDISSHVNFKDLVNIAKKFKLQIDEYCTQGEFLIKYGILDRKKKLSNNNNAKGIDLDVKRLVNKEEMGDLFKCLVISNL